MNRFAAIDAAYVAALNGRDPSTVSIFDLMPAILDAVPDTTPDEIATALRCAAAKALREAEQLERYLNAKFSNAGKSGQPGDGTLPFGPRK
jgi:hypothetical protein